MSKRPPLRSIDFRSRSILAFFLVVALVLGGRLVRLQAYESEDLSKKAQEQRNKKRTIQPLRGRILDRDGKELAVTLELENVFINPRVVRRPFRTGKILSKALGIDPAVMKEKLASRKYFVYLAKGISAEKADELRGLKIEGLDFEANYKRHYPNKNLAPQLIGFTSNEGKGGSGIELQYEKVLGGSPGELMVENDAKGQPIPGGVYVFREPQDGKDIFLTIDADIQYYAQQSLDKATEKYEANWAGALLVEISTGNVLASAISPSPDLTKPREELAPFKNRLMTDRYEPGSVMKSLIIAAGQEQGFFKEGEKIYLPPTLKVADKTIKEAHRGNAVTYTIDDILAQSSNIGTVLIAQRMGKQNIYDFLVNAGITSPSGPGFPGEALGSLPAPRYWSGTSIANIPFGQGVAVTPAELLRSMIPLANKGNKVKLNHVYQKPGLRKDEGQLFSSHTAGRVLDMLRLAVVKGTGAKADVEGYGTAGKTGTAQKPRADGRGYEKSKYVASFLGFSPAENPKLAMIVLFDEPYPIYGGETAGPVYKDIMGFALRHLRVAPPSVSALKRVAGEDDRSTVSSPVKRD